MPYSPKSKYLHKRQQPPKNFVKGTIKTVPVTRASTPTGSKYKREFPKGTKAVVGQIKPSLRKKGQRKYQTQSILIPKRRLRNEQRKR